MATNIGTAFFNVTFNTAAARREVTAMVSNINRNFGLIGGAALVGATAAIAGLVRATAEIGQAALTASIEYEQAFASVRKTVDDGTMSAEEASRVFGKLNQDLRDLALEVPLDLEENIAKVAELGGQLGIPADQLTEFTRIIGEVGVTTNVAVEDAATAFARIANIMGLGADDFRALGDTLINLGNKLPAQEDEILRFGNRIAAAGELAGFTADEVLAVSAAMASVGVPAERGGTAIQKAWIRIIEATSQGGENLELIAQVSGTTAEEFKEHWQRDAAGAWTDFIEGLGRAGDRGFQILKDLELNDQRVIQSLLSIANAGDLMRTTFGFAADDMGALSQESSLFFNTTAGQMQLFQNRLHDVSISIGDEMKPAFRDILFTLNEWIQNNPELIEQLGERLAVALEEVGGLIKDMLPAAENLLELLPELTRETVEWAGPLVEVAGGILEVANAFVQLRRMVGEGAESGGGLVQGLNALTDFLMQGGIQGAFKTFDRIESLLDLASTFDPSRINAFWRIFPVTGVPIALADFISGFGDEIKGAAIQTQRDIEAALAAGQSPVSAAFEELVNLQERVREIEGPDARIPDEFFFGLIQNAKMSREEVEQLFHLLRMEGVHVPSFAEMVGETDIARGHAERGGGRPKSAAAIALEDAEDLADAAAAAEIAAAAQDQAIGLMRESAEAYGVSIDVVLDNLERLAPAALDAFTTADVPFDEAALRADLFAQSLSNLRDIIQFRPATEGIFGVGDIVEGLKLAETTLAETGEAVRLHGADVQKNIIDNLNKIAEFEANLTILYARGFDDLARLFAAQGPEFAHVVADFVSGARTDAEVTEAILENGGTISDETQRALDEALASGDVPQGLLDFIAQMGSDQVQQTAYDNGYASGKQYGDGFHNGLYASLPGWLLGFLGINMGGTNTQFGSLPDRPPSSRPGYSVPINPSTGFPMPPQTVVNLNNFAAQDVSGAAERAAATASVINGQVRSGMAGWSP